MNRTGVFNSNIKYKSPLNDEPRKKNVTIFDAKKMRSLGSTLRDTTLTNSKMNLKQDQETSIEESEQMLTDNNS